MVPKNSTPVKILTKHYSIVASAIAISRILGYIRDLLVAQFFGASLFADAFYAAFRIPNLFRRLLGEGSMTVAFVPVFSEYLVKEKKENIQQFLNIIFTTLTLICIIIILLGIIFARQITQVIAWGFNNVPYKFDLTVTLLRIMFPYLGFICLAALFMAVLNSIKRFFIPTVASMNLSIAEIIFIIFLASSIKKPIIGLAIAAVVGGILQAVFQLPAILRHGFTFKLQFDITHPGLKKVTELMLPATIGFSVEQINVLVDTICASFLIQGSVTVLYYSNRVMQFPLALFGIAMAIVSLPTFSASVAEENIIELKNTLIFSIKTVIFMLLPATVGLIYLGKDIIRLLFQYGHFTNEATLLTAQALSFYSPGLVAFAIVKLLANAFYSLKETKTPVRIATICLLVNIVLNILLMFPMGVSGLALATSLSSWLNVILLFYCLQKRIGKIDTKDIVQSTAKTAISAIGICMMCYICLQVLPFPFTIPVGVITSIAIYFILSAFLKIDIQEMVIGLIWQRRK